MIEPTVPTPKITPAARPTGQSARAARCTMSGVAMPSATSGGPNRTRLAASDCATNAWIAVSCVYSSGPDSQAENIGPSQAMRSP